MRHGAVCTKGDAAATWKTVKLGGWKRSELLVSNRRNSSLRTPAKHGSSAFLSAFLLLFKWVNQEAITANRVLNLVIEITSEIKRGWAAYIKASGRQAGLSLGDFWLPTAASGGVWGQIPLSRTFVDFDRFIKTHLFKQMADAPSALGSSFLSNSTRAGHRIDTEYLLHHPRYEGGEGPEI